MSRPGQRMDYWGGATNIKCLCGCAVTSTCDASNYVGNCNIDDTVWREDSGMLTDKA